MVLGSAEPFQLREPGVSYLINFGPENDNTGVETGISGKIISRFKYDILARPRRASIQHFDASLMFVLVLLIASRYYQVFVKEILFVE